MECFNHSNKKEKQIFSSQFKQGRKSSNYKIKNKKKKRKKSLAKALELDVFILEETSRFRRVYKAPYLTFWSISSSFTYLLIFPIKFSFSTYIIYTDRQEEKEKSYLLLLKKESQSPFSKVKPNLKFFNFFFKKINFLTFCFSIWVFLFYYIYFFKKRGTKNL